MKAKGAVPDCEKIRKFPKMEQRNLPMWRPDVKHNTKAINNQISNLSKKFD